MTTEDTIAYVRMQLHCVGYNRELFASETLAALHAAAGLSLREINRLATGARHR